MVRKDVIEQKFAEYDQSKALNSIQDQYGKVSSEEYAELQNQAIENQKKEGKKVREFLWEILRNAKVQKSFPPALQQVFEEELAEYRKGVINEEMVSDHLEKRFWLYLEEAK